MAKKIGPKSYDHMKKESDLSDQKKLMKMDKVKVVSSKFANFATYAFFTLAPPSSYTLNLKALTEVLKVS